MELKVNNNKKKQIVKVVIWAVVIVVILATMHLLVNYFDMFAFLQKLHGG